MPDITTVVSDTMADDECTAWEVPYVPTVISNPMLFETACYVAARSDTTAVMRLS